MAATEKIQHSHTQTATDKDHLKKLSAVALENLILHMLAQSARTHI